MTSFALYRLPYEQQVTLVAQTEGRPVELQSLAQLDGQNGFVVAPFAIGGDCPLVVIRPDVVETFPDVDSSRQRFQALQQCSRQRFQALQGQSSLRQCYADDFQRFHEQLAKERFRKIVLSRCASISMQSLEASPTNLQSLEASSTNSQRWEALPTTAFWRACKLYPRLFIALVSTPQTGTWLTATPEVLLENTAEGQWHTMALAGTMRLDDAGGLRQAEYAGGLRQAKDPTMMVGKGLLPDDDYSCIRWSEKNIEEQRLVASYIANCLNRFSDDVVETGPRTVRAANLVHLRSDFHFTLRKAPAAPLPCRGGAGVGVSNVFSARKIQTPPPTPPLEGRGAAAPSFAAERGSYGNTASVGRLLEALHPTPAVCGLPKDEAFRFILDNEHTPRRYYSGFMGPLFSSQFTVHSSQLNAQFSKFNVQCSMGTHLFVSLRCMNIASDFYHLYAGGGLLKSSTEEQEWQETEAKMETMRRCVYCSSSASMSPSM